MSVRKYLSFDDDFEGLDTMSSSSTRSSSRTSRNQKEEERIQQILFDPKVNPYDKINDKKRVPDNYTCNRCNQKGHFIYDCPQKPGKANNTVKRSSGIPRSFLKTASADTPGARITKHGKLLHFPIDIDVFQSNMITDNVYIFTVFLVVKYSGGHISWHDLFLAGNQGNNQNFVQSLVSLKL